MRPAPVSLRNILLVILLIPCLLGCSNHERYSHQQKAQAGICLSFDDRNIDQLFALRDLFNQYHAKVTLYITHWDSLTTEEIGKIRILQQDGHEIASHGALHTLAEEYRKEHSLAEYLNDEVVTSIRQMKASGFSPTAFAYPYGEADHTEEDVLQYFYTVRLVAAVNKAKDLTAMDKIYYSFDGARVLYAVGIDHNAGVSVEMIEAGIERAVKRKEVLMLYAHEPDVTNTGKNYTFEISLLEEVLKAGNERRLIFYTASGLVI